MTEATLYIFIDEGGNIDFSNKGTNFFTLTALSKIRPFAIYGPLIDLKYDLWEKGIEFEYFHATEDTQKTRNEVFGLISKNISRFTVDSIVVEKRKTNPSLYFPVKFYQKIFQVLLNYVLERYKDRFSKIIIITDAIPVTKNRREIQKAIKQYITNRSFSYRVFHHSSKSDINLQIVDYLNWAIFRKWESGDLRSYNVIKEAVFSEFNAT